MANLIFKNADEIKDAIMESQKKEIADLYEKWADEIGERAKYYSHKTTASAPLSERYYKELQKQIRATSQEVSNEIYGKIKKNIYTISDAVVADNIKWLESLGFSKSGLNAAFSYVPDEIVRNLVTGQIYQGGWNLSSRIWGDNEQTLKDIYQVMAKGLAENKPIYQIAKDLEKYVRPSAKLPWNKVAPDGVKIYKKQVDYNAQRLARTLVQHGYQQSFIATTQKNPFILEYIWRSNGSRVCELCMARDGVHYKKDELPMDHPNGMCTMEPVVSNNMVDQLADWFNSPDGTYPEIDEFAGNFGYNASKSGTLDDYLAKYGKSDKSWGAYVKSLSPIQKAEAKLLKDQAGQSWQQWYESNVYTGTGPSANYKTKATKTVKAFSDTQEKYLKPYGFSPDNMPVNFDDWSHKISHEQASEILKSMGTSWSDPHPYQQLMKYYNANLTNANFVDKAATVAKTSATKASKIDIAFNYTKEELEKAIDKQYFIGHKDSTEIVEKFIKSKGLNPSDFVDGTGVYDPNKLKNIVSDHYSYKTKVDLSSWENMLSSQKDRNYLYKLRQSEDSWEKLLSDAEKKAVNAYTKENNTNCYKQQNGFLRFGEDVSATVKNTVKKIQSALDKSVTTEDMILVRGTKTSLYTDIFTGDLKKALDNKDVSAMAGQLFRDPGFLSTSPNGGEFGGDLKFKIFAPAGTKGGYVENNNHFGEKEFLLQSNTAYYIEKAEKDSRGVITMYLRILTN